MADAETKTSETTDENKTNAEVDTSNSETDLAKLQKDLDNSRKGEKYNKKLVEKLTSELEALTKLAPDLKDLREAAKQRDEYKTKFEETEKARSELDNKIRNNLIDVELDSVLKELKARDVGTAKKLLDRTKVVIKDDKVDSESIKNLVQELVKSDPILFDASAVSVKRAGEEVSKAGYEAEMKALVSKRGVTQRDIEAVVKKYGIIK